MLNERTMKDICECEQCGKYPLKHLEKCPHCNSEAYHKTKVAFYDELVTTI